MKRKLKKITSYCIVCKSPRETLFLFPSGFLAILEELVSSSTANSSVKLISAMEDVESVLDLGIDVKLLKKSLIVNLFYNSILRQMFFDVFIKLSKIISNSEKCFTFIL